MPKVTHYVAPVYPDEAKEDHLEGEVFVKILVNIDGLPLQEIVIKSSNEIFNQPAIDASKAFMFTPLIKNGTKEICWVVIPFKFALR